MEQVGQQDSVCRPSGCWLISARLPCSSGSYTDLEGQHHHDDFDVTLVVCHNAAPFEEQSDMERHLLR